MKHKLKQFLSLSLVLMMCVGLFCGTATAVDSGSGTGSDDHLRYDVYQLFTGDVSNGAISNAKWGANGKGTPGERVDDSIMEKINMDVTQNPSGDGLRTRLLKDIAMNADSEPYASNLSLEELSARKFESGYYLIQNTSGSVGPQDGYTIGITTVTDGKISVVPKAGTASVHKYVVDDAIEGGLCRDAYVSYGDTVTFELRADLPDNIAAWTGFWAEFVDTIPKGFDVDINSVRLVQNSDDDERDVDMSMNTRIGVNTGLSGGSSDMSVSLEDNVLTVTVLESVMIDSHKALGSNGGQSITPPTQVSIIDDTIVVRYEATATEDMLVSKENVNTVVLNWSNDPSDDYFFDSFIDSDSGSVDFDKVPEAPTRKDLYGILGNFVMVQCVSEGDNLPHDAKLFSTVGYWNDTVVGEVIKNSNDKYTCELTFHGETYAILYGAALPIGTDVLHTLTDGEQSIKTFTLTWDGKNWTSGKAKNTILATFEVKCAASADADVSMSVNDSGVQTFAYGDVSGLELSERPEHIGTTLSSSAFVWTAGLTVHVQDSKGNMIPNAKFELQYLDGELGGTTTRDENLDILSSQTGNVMITTDENGMMTLTGLALGKYKLHQVESVEGYSDVDDVEFEICQMSAALEGDVNGNILFDPFDNGWTGGYCLYDSSLLPLGLLSLSQDDDLSPRFGEAYMVDNWFYVNLLMTSGVNLPVTGGSGVYFLYGGGAVLLIGAFVFLLVRRHRRNKQVED